MIHYYSHYTYQTISVSLGLPKIYSLYHFLYLICTVSVSLIYQFASI